MQAKPQQSLVYQAQQIIEGVLKSGDLAIDATLGNGHDTLFLARCVGKRGRVYGFDIQQQAIEITGQRLKAAGQVNQAVLIKQGHESLGSVIPNRLQGKIAAVMFNLGYLPGADKRVTTAMNTTLQALEQAANLLKVNGVITLVAYTGHPGGSEETEAVKAMVSQWPATCYNLRFCDTCREAAPQLIVITKIASAATLNIS